MSATESLDEYIRKFQNDKGKYKPSLLSSSFSETITDTASSIDTEELLSETSSSSYSEYLNPKKRSKLKPENRKHKKKHGPSIKGLKQPSHLKPLHRTPLKIINEEDEFSSYMRYDISQYLPHEYGAVQMGNQDMRNYLPKPVNSQIGERVRNVYYNYRQDTDSDTYSTCSSVDTEALLDSSDEEDIETTINKIKKVNHKQTPQPAISRKRETVSNGSRSPSRTSMYDNGKQVNSLSLPTRDIPAEYLPYTPNPNHYKLKSATVPPQPASMIRPPSNYYSSSDSEEFYRQVGAKDTSTNPYRPYEQFVPNIPNPPTYQPKLMRNEMVQVSEGAFNPRLYGSESLSDHSPSPDLSKLGSISSPELPHFDLLQNPVLPPQLNRYTIPSTNRTNTSDTSQYRRDAPADTGRSNYNPMLSINSDSQRKFSRTQSPSIEKKEEEAAVYGDSFSHDSVHNIHTPAFSNRKQNAFPNLYQESERLRTIPEVYRPRDSFESTIQACIKQESDRKPYKVLTVKKGESVCIEPVSHEASANSASMQTRSSLHMGMLDTLGRSYTKPAERKTIQLRICTCILQGYEKIHTPQCRPLEVTAFLPDIPQPKAQKLTYNQAAIKIQRAWRRYSKPRNLKKPSVQIYLSSSPLLTPLEESFSKKDLDTSLSSMDYKQESTNTLTYSQSVMNSTAEIEKATKSLYQALEQLKALKKFTTAQDSLDSSLTFTDSCFSKEQAKNQMDVSESIISSSIQSPFLSPHAIKSWQPGMLPEPKSISNMKFSPIKEPANFMEQVRIEHDFLQTCQDESRSSDDTEALLNSSDSFMTS